MYMMKLSIVQNRCVSYLLVEDFIADRIRELCIKRDMTRYRLSQITGIEQSTLSNLMTRKSLPNIVTLSRICDGFGITLSQFFQEGNEMLDLSKEQRHMLETWSDLSEEERKYVSIYVQGLQHK